MAQNARQQTRHSIDQHHRGNRAIGQDIIADRDFRVGQMLDHAVINAFIMPADDDQMRLAAKNPPPFAD